MRNVYCSCPHPPFFFFLLLVAGFLKIPVPIVAAKQTTSRILKCCGITDPDKLWDCLKRETKAYSDRILTASSKTSNQPIEAVVVTYVTSNIVHYAAFSVTIVALWAELHEYPMHIYEKVENEDAHDPRWNKVPSVLHAITQWAPTAKAALWVDADMTILNMSATVQDFYRQIPPQQSPSKDPHFFVCAEYQGSSTTVNSGSFLVKNTEIGRELLQRWWNVANRTLLDDQQAFDLLLAKRERFIHILPISFFNSEPPVMTQLHPSDRVIHLMGETNMYREHVFRYAYTQTCRANQQQQQHQEPAYQLGITSSFLLDTALTVHQVEYQQIMMQDPLQPVENLEEYTDLLARVSHILGYAMDRRGKSPQANQIRCEVYRRLSSVMDSYQGEKDSESMKRKLSYGIRCLNTMETLEEVHATYNHLREDLAYLQKQRKPVRSGNIIMDEVELEENMAMHYIKRQMWDKALEKQIMVVTIMTRHHFPKDKMMNSWATLAGLLCSTGKNVLSFPFFEATIAHRIQRFGPTHSSLAVDYFNMGACKYEVQMLDQALKDLKKCLDVLDENSVSSTDDMRLRASTYYKKVKDTIEQLQRQPPVPQSIEHSLQ